MPLDKFPAACLTNWGAVVGLQKDPKEENNLYYAGSLHITDPCSIDAGMVISNDDIKLLWRKKPERWFVYYLYNGKPCLDRFVTGYDARAYYDYSASSDAVKNPYRVLFLYEASRKVVHKKYHFDTFLEEQFAMNDMLRHERLR